MSVRFRTIAVTAPASMAGLTDHLMTQTLKPDDLVLAKYYERQEGLAVLRPDISPRVLLGLGIDTTQPLAKENINNLLAGMRSDNGEKVAGRHYAERRALPVNPKDGVERHSAPIAAIDFAITPHKSISVAYAFANPAERAAIFTAHIDAARVAMAQIAEDRGSIRLGKGGLKGTLPAEVGWLEFTHRTARKVAGDDKTPGDPDIHTHFTVFAATFGENGKVGSFDSGRLEGPAFANDALYNAQLAQNLRNAGFAADLDPETGAAFMPIIPADVNRLFSKRSNRGEELAREYTESRGESWADLSADQRSKRISIVTQSREQRMAGGKDDTADFDGWQRQAKAIGWEAGPSFKRTTTLEAELPQAERLQVALDAGLPYLADRLEHRAVLPDWELRIAAGRGLVKAGFAEPADIDRVVDLMRSHGVRQNGARTELSFAIEPGRRFTYVTTARHEADEREFVRLVDAAVKDHSGDIPAELLNRKVAESGLDFTGEHGQAQREAIDAMGRGGRYAMLIAASGMGKTTSLKPLVAAWAEQGRDVWGTSLGSRQADALTDAGIRQDRVRAISPLLDSIAEGTVKLGRRSVVIIDEVSQLGTRQGLELLRAREKHGFSVVAIGDDKQTAAIEAGNFISLAERAKKAVRIETTIRQKSDREKEIAGLFRQGRAAEGLAMKRDDGTAVMLPGSRSDVIDGIARLYAERLTATGKAPTITAPINQDAHDISAAVRRERRQMGLIGQDLVTLKATDGTRSYDLPLAVGDHVRLFRNTRAAGFGRGGSIGRNQSVLEVVGISSEGITMKTAKGRVALVHIEDLTDKATRRVMLAYGNALTVHSGQGISSAEHINALPSGSVGVNGLALYSGSTRHEHSGYIVASGDAEMRAVRSSRPINDPRPISDADKWANVALAFAQQPEKDTALSLFSRSATVQRGTLHGHQSATLPPAVRETPERAASVVQRRKLDLSPVMGRVMDVARELPRQAKDLALDIWEQAIERGKVIAKEQGLDQRQTRTHRRGLRM